MERKTKIVATVSDRRCEVEFVRSLYEAGMNVVRINSAHVTTESADILVNNVRSVSDQIAILIDTKGPEVRTTEIEDPKGIAVEAGDIINVKGGATNSTKECLYMSAESIAEHVPVGASLLIDDGDIELVIIDKKDDSLVAEVRNRGVIKRFKSVNVPGVHIPLPSITERDKEFIEWAIDRELDFIAHSFVRSKEDLLALHDIINAKGSHIKIISKIENQEGVDNFDEILKYTYGVMIARGDLGIEIPGEQIPIVQRQLVKRCVENKTPVIIATQMLQSMITNPRPTRAEISDVANAIYQRTDAIMLSGETANGEYPVEAVQVMDKVARKVEKDTTTIVDVALDRINNEITAELARSAVRACVNLPVKAVVIDTLSGRTGRYLSSFRGDRPVYAVCYRKHVMRELSLSYGIYPEYQEPSFTHHNFLSKILISLQRDSKIGMEDLVVVVGGDFGAAQGASFMEICSVIALQNKYMKQNNTLHG
ncbi:MAG: pyruvate kinase [Rikenellaceae bacterium]